MDNGDNMRDVLIFAHRGVQTIAPENTILAFEKALEIGIDGIELDVQLTKDGEIVVIHDEELGRICNGIGLVKDMSYGYHTANVVKECEYNGIHINTWTVDKEEDIKKMIRMGVSGIVSNRPDLVKKIRSEEKRRVDAF